MEHSSNYLKFLLKKYWNIYRILLPWTTVIQTQCVANKIIPNIFYRFFSNGLESESDFYLHI